MSITEAAAATPTAATPAPRVNIHGFPASGAPPANTHTQFSDTSGDDGNDDDGEDNDDGDDSDDDDDNASNTAGLFQGLLNHPAIAAMVGQIPSPGPAVPVDTTTTTDSDSAMVQGAMEAPAPPPQTDEDSQGAGVISQAPASATPWFPP